MFVVALAMMHTPAQAGSSAISRKLDKVTASLTKDYRAKHPKKTGVSLAVFSLSSSKALARRGVGFAVSELLMRQFVKSPTFTVVERSALNKVLEEQKLQLTGVIDSATAVRVGKIIGAEVLLLGNVEKLGSNYHVTARLVDAQSGEVVSVGYEELSASLFEEEAKPFLTLAPKKREIGIYFLFNTRRNANNIAPQATTAFFWGTPGTVNPNSFTQDMVGGGIRYAPIEQLMLDFSVAYVTGLKQFASSDVIPTVREMQGRSRMIRGSANWIYLLPWKTRSILGLGAAYYDYHASGTKIGKVTTPFLRGGIEFRPQPRIGVGLLMNYDFLGAVGRDEYGQNAEILKVNKLSFESTVSLYF